MFLARVRFPPGSYLATLKTFQACFMTSKTSKTISSPAINRARNSCFWVELANNWQLMSLWGCFWQSTDCCCRIFIIYQSVNLYKISRSKWGTTRTQSDWLLSQSACYKGNVEMTARLDFVSFLKNFKCVLITKGSKGIPGRMHTATYHLKWITACWIVNTI